MAYYQDGTRFAELGEGNFKAIGWLMRDEPYPHWTPNTETYLTEEVFEKLCQLCVQPWQPATVGGSHPCELCRFTGGSSVAHYKGHTIGGISANLLLVPGREVVYVAPVGIIHYLDAHGYVPPDSFCLAVSRCPAMRSSAYFKAIMDNGGRGLLRHSHA